MYVHICTYIYIYQGTQRHTGRQKYHKPHADTRADTVSDTMSFRTWYGITYSYVRHDAFMCAAWLICATWRIRATWLLISATRSIVADTRADTRSETMWFRAWYDMTHSYVRRDSFICATWFTCATWLIGATWLFISATRFIVADTRAHTLSETMSFRTWCDMTPSNVRRDSSIYATRFICATWLIRATWLFISATRFIVADTRTDTVSETLWIRTWRDMTHSYVRRDSFICATWFIWYCWHKDRHCFWNSVVSNLTWHDSFISFFQNCTIHAETRAITMSFRTLCDVTHSYMQHDSFTCATWLIRRCDMTHSYVQHDSFICATWLIHIFHMNRHDTFMRNWTTSRTVSDNGYTWIRYVTHRNESCCIWACHS